MAQTISTYGRDIAAAAAALIRESKMRALVTERIELLYLERAGKTYIAYVVRRSDCNALL